MTAALGAGLLMLLVGASATDVVATAPVDHGRRRVLVLDLATAGIDGDTARIIGDSVAAAVAKDASLDVLSGVDVRTLLDVEAGKQALGGACDASSDACLAEIAGALAADLIVSGSIGKLGSLTVVNLGLYDSRAQQSAGKVTVQAESLERLAREIDGGVATLFGRAPPSTAPAPLLVVGGTVAAIGVTTSIVTGLGLGWSFGVQDDPGTAGRDKEGAESAWPILVGGAVLGGAAVVAGTGLAIMGMLE